MAATASSKSNASKSISTAGSKSTIRKPRRKTGAARRQSQRRMGRIVMVDDSKATTPQEAMQIFLEGARAAVAWGMTTRVPVEADVAAAPGIIVMCRADAAEFQKRALPPNTVDAAELILHELQHKLGPVPVVAAAAKGKAKSAPVAEEDGDPTAYSEAYNFAARLRRAIARVAKGPVNAQVRRAFGVHLALRRDDPTSIVRAINGLVAWRKSRRAGMIARRYVTDADAKEGAALVKRVLAVHGADVAARKASQRQKRRVAILHAALEIFFDRYAAAAEMVYRNDEAQMIDALALIPKRELRHGSAADESSSQTEGQTPTTEGQTPTEGQSSSATQAASGQGGTPPAIATSPAAGQAGSSAAST